MDFLKTKDSLILKVLIISRLSILKYSLTKVKTIVKKKTKTEKYLELDIMINNALNYYFKEYPKYQQVDFE